jgi:TonB family protein
MKPLYVTLTFLATLFFLTVACGVTAAAQDTAYFSYVDKPTVPQLASYYMLTAHTDSGWTCAEHWMNNRLKITGSFSDDMKTRLGTFIYYDTAGTVVQRRKYVGYGGAIETDYYPDGQVMVQGSTLDEKKGGEWTGYYPSGKIKATALYTDGQLDTCSFFNEDGSPNDTMKIFCQESDYPGGVTAWLRFLNRNLHYPDAAVNQEIQGTVVVQFKVSKEGKTSDFTVIESRGRDLDDEAVRVMKKSGDWQPAVNGGTAVDAYKTQQVVFRMGNWPPPPSGDEDYDKTFTKTEIESYFPGGDPAWLRYLSRNLQYPRDAIENRVQGTVVVQFIVDKEGNISNVQAISGPDQGGLREEAVRVIKRSGKWTPAIQNGRQVKSYKKQPIVFKLER